MIKEKKQRMKCLVTGGAGFIGSNLVDFLISNGKEVIIIDDLSTGKKENVNPEATFIQEDIVNLEKIKPLFDDVDFVFHLAALPRIQPSFDDPIEHEEANVIGTINCLLACKGRKRIKKFIFAGSSAIYGNPDELPTSEGAKINCLNPYSLQKYIAEQYCLILGKEYRIPVISLRYFNPYGPRSFNPKNPFNAYSSVIGIFENKRKERKPLTITGNGEQSRDFVHVQDLAKAHLLAAESNYSDKIYNIGFGKSYTVNQIAEMFKADYVYIPERKGEAIITLANINKIKKELNWTPEIKVEDYIKKIIN